MTVFTHQLLVSQNATETLRAAVVAADGTYIANRSVSVYIAEARSENAQYVVGWCSPIRIYLSSFF